MIIKALFVLLVISVLAVIGVVIAGWVRVRRHMSTPPDPTTVLRKYDNERKP